MRMPCTVPRSPRPLAALATLLGLALLLGAGPALGYSSYSANPVTNTGNCAHCHGDFNGGIYTSLKDGTNWGTNLMNGHSPWIGFDCGGCHPSFPGSVPVSLHMSGSATFGLSCVGCHGRAEDAGIPTGLPVAYSTSQSGAGLRQRHFLANTIVNGTSTQVCSTCHADADPANVVLSGEDILPPNFPLIFWDSCSDAQHGLTGLDNDGDGAEDGTDLDCGGGQGTDNPDSAYRCGNSVVESIEDCDDGNTTDGDCCSATCEYQGASGVGGMPDCCFEGACQVGTGCGTICFTPGAICKQPGGAGTLCTCELP